MKILRTIAVVFALLSIVNGYALNFTENNVIQLQKALHESVQYLSQEVRDEHVTICIGATRSGKSTLINYLIGNELKAVRLSRFDPITIKKVDTQSIGPEIGSGSTSKTTIPTRWVSKNVHDFIIWDAPGFDDNRGPVQDITNAFYLYQLIQNVKSLKIVLVVDINDILHDNIKPFLSVLKAVENLLGNKTQNYFTSISVIFTKVPDTLDDVPVDMEFINAKLYFQFLNSTDMELSQVSKEFVQFLLKSNNHIGFFKRPTALGDITSTVDVNIFSSIKNSASIQKNHLQQLSPSISESSTLSLFQIRDKLFSTSVFDKLVNAVRHLCEKKVNETSILSNNKQAEKELRELNNELKIIEGKLFNITFIETDFLKKMQILETIDIDIKNKIEEYKILEQIKLMGFVDKLLDLKESKILAIKIGEVLSTIHLIVKEAVASIAVKLGEITKEMLDEIMKNKSQEYQKQVDEAHEKLKELERKNKQKISFWDVALFVAIGAFTIATGGTGVVTLG